MEFYQQFLLRKLGLIAVNFNANWIVYFLKNGNLRSLDSGSAQSQITTGDLYAESVLVPSIKLQGHFNKVTEIIMKRKEFLKNEISLLENFQSLLLSKLATIEN